MTVAAFMELALYDPELAYSARTAQRSGRAGDFFTSVDVGPLFGALLEAQLAEMAALLSDQSPIPHPQSHFDLVEAGAGNARLSADILRAARARHPALYDSLRLHLVEASAVARAAQRATLGDAADRLVYSGGAMPASFDGVLIANELLDAMRMHQVVMREDGLREIYVSSKSQVPSSKSQVPSSKSQVPSSKSVASLETRDSRLETRDLELGTVEGSPSTPALQAYLDRAGVTLEPGWRAEINLRAVDWVREATRRLGRGFMILVDYGHEARELYSATHLAGTLTSFSG